MVYGLAYTQKAFVFNVCMGPTLWLSFGENCLTLNILRRFGLKSPSTVYSSARSNMEHVLRLEETDYEGFLNPENLYRAMTWGKEATFSSLHGSDPGVFQQGPKSDFEFTHVDPLGPEMGGRVLRQRELRRDVGKKVLVYHHRSTVGFGQKAKEFLEQGGEYLLGRYENSACVFFTQQVIGKDEPRGFEVSAVGDRMLFCVLRTHLGWGGENIWAMPDNDLLVLAWTEFCDRLGTGDRISI